jgi:hypothetical protein
VALEDQLGPLEQQRRLGGVFLGGQFIKAAVEVLGNS